MQQATEITRLIPLDKVRDHERNYRNHTEQQVLNLIESLKRFGQVRGIVVQDRGDGTYTTVAGHGVTKAARKLGWKEIKAEILPQSWSETDVRGYLIADNYHSQHARDDEYTLAELFQEQVDAGFDLASMGSSERDLRQLFTIIQNSHESDFLTPFLKTEEQKREDRLEEKEKLREAHNYVPPVVQSYGETAGTVNYTVTAPPMTSVSYEIPGGTVSSQTVTNTLPPSYPSFDRIPQAEQFYPMTYTFTGEQRKVVLSCINQVKERDTLTSSAEALAKICEEWQKGAA